MCNQTTSINNNNNTTSNSITKISVPDTPTHHSELIKVSSSVYFDVLPLTNSIQNDQNPNPINMNIINNDNDNDNDNNNNNNNNVWSYFQEWWSSLFVRSLSEVIKDSGSLFTLAFPILLTNLILYSRSMLSMVFLGRIGEAELAAGSLAIAFANITGYSVFSGLALGMEPLCSQAFGARRPKLLSLTLQRCVIFLLVCCFPLGLIWVNVSSILRFLHQDPKITNLAHVYITFCLPDLFTNSFYHPIKIYLRAQGITRPVTLASLAGAFLHVPIMMFLVVHLGLGIAGVAIANSASNLVSLAVLVLQVWLRRLHVPTWSPPSRECLTGWWPLVCLAAPSCASVCLEWWWYEIMIVLCGLLEDPQALVASMGVLIQTTGLIYNFPAALSNAVSARVGNELGSGRPKGARRVGLVGVFWAGSMGLTALTFTYGARDMWAKMFTKDVEILSLTAAALPILGLCELGNCPQTVACGVVRGTARPTTAANVNLGAFYVVGAPVAVGMAFYYGYGFSGLWIGLLSAQVCCAGLLFYVVGTTDWNLQAKRAQLLTRYGASATGPSLDTKGGVDTSLLLPDDDDKDDDEDDDDKDDDEDDDDDDDDGNKENVEEETDPLFCILVTSY